MKLNKMLKGNKIWKRNSLSMCDWIKKIKENWGRNEV
jgi:hypothetical protein